MNAFSLDGVFTPLTVTDRLIADPPAFGVALAHAWPSDVPSHRSRRRSGARRGRGARDRERARPTRRSGSARTEPDVIEVAARLGGGHDAELCRGAVGVDLNDARARLRPRRDEHVCPEPQRASVGGACVLFLVAPEGRAARASRASTRRARSRASVECGSTASPADGSGRCAAAPTGPARCSPPAPSRDEALARARRAARRSTLQSSMTRVDTNSASSRPRSARRRSRRSPRRSARAG